MEEAFETLRPVLIAAAAFFFAMVVLYIFIKFRASRGPANSGMPIGAGLSVPEIERMKREGLINEEEFKRIKAKAAQRALEQSRRQSNPEHDREILAEVAANPDAALKLLTPEQIAEAERRRQAIASGEPVHSAAPVPPPAPPVPPAAATKNHVPEIWGDPLAEIEAMHPTPAAPPGAPSNSPGAPPPAVHPATTPAVPPSPQPSRRTVLPPAPADTAPERITRPAPGRLRIPPPRVTPGAPPSMNMPRVVKEREEAAAEQKQGELELLLEKGAISQEEYNRLKQFFTPPASH